MDHYAECFVPLGEEDAAFFEDNNYTDSDINNDPTVRYLLCMCFLYLCPCTYRIFYVAT